MISFLSIDWHYARLVILRGKFDSYRKLYCGVLAEVASQFHKLKVEGSNPSPVTKVIIMEEVNRSGKIMVATEAQTVRELTDLANKYKIPREDIVSVLPSREGYVMVYYY